jgi:hypothetical protein
MILLPIQPAELKGKPPDYNMIGTRKENEFPCALSLGYSTAGSGG